MDKSLSKNYEFSLIKDWNGYVSAVDPTKVDSNIMTFGSQNIYRKKSGTLAVRPGMLRRGTADSTISGISSEFVWNTSWGAVYPIFVANSTLYVEVDGTVNTLLGSLSKTRYVFDKWWDNTEKKDRVLFVNGTDDLQHWSGGTAYVSTTGSTSITKTVPATTWKQAGFSDTTGEKKIMIAGTEYTYTGGETTTTLTGVTPDASAIVAGTIAIQSVLTETNTPASGFNSDFIKVINNQAYVGSYTSRLCYISKDSDFSDYTFSTPRVPGEGELLTLDSALKGIGVKNGNAWIGYGSGEWAEIKFENITVGTTLTQQTIVNVKPISKLAAPYAHEFIGNSGNNIIYLAQDKQVRIIGDFNNSFTSGYPSISLPIKTELDEEVFTNGGIKCIGEFIYLTAPNSGKVYLYEENYFVNDNGEVVADRLWHSPMTWGASRIDEIDGTTYVFSNSNPQIYQIWDTDQWHDDSPSDEELPYECILSLGYRNLGQFKGGDRTKLLAFDKVYTEGYIASGTPLNLNIKYEYAGSKKILEAPINSTERPAILFSGETAGSLGDESLGDTPLGDVIQETSLNDLDKFRTINGFSINNCFEYQITYTSNEANARWELLASGQNIREAEQSSTFIINK